MRSTLLGLAGCALVAVLSGCSSTGSSRYTCPAVIVAPDLDAIALFGPGEGRAVSDVQVGAKLEAARIRCRREEHGVAVDTRVDITGFRNAPDIRTRDVTYFVAITDGQRNIVAEQDFTMPIEFVPRQNFRKMEDAITQHIPLSDLKAGDTYVVIFGFRLSSEQLAFNRAHRGP
jgi:hypothetical protein